MITANTTHGRVLIALRAGQMSAMQLRERIPFGSHVVTALLRDGLVEISNDLYRLTAAGREACPNRRDARLEPMHARKSQAKQQGACA